MKGRKLVYTTKVKKGLVGIDPGGDRLLPMRWGGAGWGGEGGEGDYT